MDKTRKGAALGAAAGGAIGAMIGKKAGNSAIGATIGAALGGSTGAFIAGKLKKTPDSLRNSINTLYVINGIPMDQKYVHDRLSKVATESITSVKVLTNSEAVALYGTKGENGAILISFKEGK
ncbi:hypothetical protein [Hufsiella ginkgonis]|nr:hypothetical protein [Hufsiella ginkgonis]